MSRPLTVLLVAALAGCGGLFQNQQPTSNLYTLHVPSAPAFPVPLEGILIVPRPVAAPGLDSDLVAVALPGGRRDAYRGMRFEAAVPDLVQSRLVDSLRERGGWRAVLTERSAFAGRYRLQTEIRDFVADYGADGAAPRVRVRLIGALGRTRASDLIATVAGSGEAVAAGNQQHAVIAAFDAALGAAVVALGDAAQAACAQAETQPLP